MSWLLAGLAAWAIIALPVGILIGRMARLGDDIEQPERPALRLVVEP